MNNPGLTPAVQMALQRRGGGTPQLNQVSPQAPMQNAVPQPMNSSEMTASSNPELQTKRPSDKYQPKNRGDIAIMALAEYLKNDQQIQKEALKLKQGQINVPTPQPSTPKPQGINFTGSSSVANTQKQDMMKTPLV